MPVMHAVCVEEYAPEVLLPAAATALASVQQPRCKCAVLTWFCDEMAAECSIASESTNHAVTVGLRCGILCSLASVTSSYASDAMLPTLCSCA